MQRNHALVVGGVVLLSMTACAGGVGLGSRTTTSAPATTTAPTTTTGPAAATATLDSPTSSTPSPTSSSAPTDWAAIVADVQPAVVRLEVASCDSRWMGKLTPPDGGRGCDGDTEAPEGDDAVLDVTVVPDSPEAGEVARSLVVHGESINHGDYEIAWELFTPKMKRDLGSLSKWESGLASSYWTDLTVGSVEVSGDAAIVEVALRTEQDARDGYKGQSCSIYSLTYSMERQGAGWLIDHASNAAGSPKACPR